MPIANSGPIGVSTLKGFWGSSAPAVSSYYRGGGIVPSQRPGGLVPGNQRPGNTSPGNPSPCSANGYTGGGANAQIFMNGNNGTYAARCNFTNGWCGVRWQDGNPNNYGPNRDTGVCCHGKYYSGTIGGTAPHPIPSAEPSTGFNPGGTNPPTTNPPTTNPPVPSNPTPLNTGIPTSGTIALSNFYGGEK